jgi:hypothetical protein
MRPRIASRRAGRRREYEPFRIVIRAPPVA